MFGNEPAGQENTIYLAQHTDYDLRVLIYTAINDNALVSISTIIKTRSIPKNHLTKVVTTPVEDGFLIGVRGRGGGLKLTKPPERVNIGSVVRHLEPMQLVECIGQDNNCLITPSCKLADILSEKVKTFLNYLDGFTLSDSSNKLTYGLPYMLRVDISTERTSWAWDFRRSSRMAQNSEEISLEYNVLYISRELTSISGFIFHLKSVQCGLNNPFRLQAAFLCWKPYQGLHQINRLPIA